MYKLGSFFNNTTEFISPFDGSKAAQRLIELFIFLMTVSYAFESFWRHESIWRIVTGAISLCVLVLSIVAGRLYLYHDVRLMLLFMLIAWFSSAICFGVSGAYFISKFHCFWMAFLALYMVIHVTPDPSHAMRVFTYASIASFSVICLYILVHAAKSLLTEIPVQHVVRGCFLNKRLCGLGNANVFGFMCTALLLISAFGFLATKKRVRFLFLLPTVLGWFSLGLTGFRTGMFGASGAIGLIISSSLFFYFGERKTWSTLIRFIVAFAIGILAGVILLLSFRLAMVIFRGIMLACNQVIHNPNLSKNLSELSARKITDDDGTLSGRVQIWIKCVRDCFKTVRRALVGISPLSNNVMVGYIDGHHELTQPHAHSVFLDTIRRFGLLGFAPWIGLLIIWIRQGVRALFKFRDDVSDRFLMACVAGLLVMGITEPVPFSDIVKSFIAIPFFIITGYCMRKARNRS